MRTNNVRAIAAVAVFIASTGMSLAQPCQPRPATNKVFAVADLVVANAPITCPESSCTQLGSVPPLAAWSQFQANQTKSNADHLIKTITSRVQPHCWSHVGGPCRIDFYPLGMGLVVHGPDDVQKEVAAVLENMRHPTEKMIQVALRFVTVSDDFFSRFGLDFDLGNRPCPANPCCAMLPECRFVDKCGVQRIGVDFDCCPRECCPKGCCQPKPIALTKQQIELLLTAVQCDPQACTTCAPTMTMQCGQTAHVCIQDQHEFVTGMAVKLVDGQQIFAPQKTVHQTGLSASVDGTISSDGKFIQLRLHGEHAFLADETKLCPVTVMVEPKFADGNKGTPIPFTQFIQAPALKTLKMDASMTVPCGGTMLVYCGKVERMAKVERNVPVLTKIPYLNRLFRNVSNVPTTEHMLVLVTPKVVSEPMPVAVGPAPTPPVPMPAVPSVAAVTQTTPCHEESSAPPTQIVPLAKAAKSAVEQRAEKMADKLVKKYHEACANGDGEKARKYARQALDLDPECFAKPNNVLVPRRVSPLPAPCSVTPVQVWGAPLPASMPRLTPPMPPVMLQQCLPPAVCPTPVHPPIPASYPVPTQVVPVPGNAPVVPQPTPARATFRQRVGHLLERPVSAATLPTGYHLSDSRPQYFRPEPGHPLEKELALQAEHDQLANQPFCVFSWLGQGPRRVATESTNLRMPIPTPPR